MMHFGFLILYALLNTVVCDYRCLCNYVVERDVLSMPSNDSDVIGSLYEFDCKPLVTEGAGWFTVAFEHKLGYVEQGEKLETQTCPGDYPDADRASTSSPVLIASSDAPSLTTTTTRMTSTQSTTQACAQLTHQSSSAFASDKFCYELVIHHHTFSDAERECMRKGGHLAHIQSLEEQKFLTTNIQHYVGDSYIWIGLQDTGREEHFEWTSGEPLSFTYWYPYRKDLFLHGLEDCVAMRTHNFVAVFDGEWEDLPCSRAHAYICQFDIQSGLNIFG